MMFPQRRRFTEGHGSGEEKSLTQGAVQPAKRLELILGLDPFGEHRHSEVVSERHNGLE